jgi:hypothetical protein
MNEVSLTCVAVSDDWNGCGGFMHASALIQHFAVREQSRIWHAHPCSSDAESRHECEIKPRLFRELGADAIVRCGAEQNARASQKVAKPCRAVAVGRSARDDDFSLGTLHDTGSKRVYVPLPSAHAAVQV